MKRRRRKEEMDEQVAKALVAASQKEGKKSGEGFAAASKVVRSPEVLSQRTWKKSCHNGKTGD